MRVVLFQLPEDGQDTLSDINVYPSDLERVRELYISMFITVIDGVRLEECFIHLGGDGKRPRLSRAVVNGRTIETFADLRLFPNLVSLDFLNTDVEYLRTVTQCVRLEKLYISYTNPGDRSVKDIPPLGGLKSLKELYLDEIPLSGLDFLRGLESIEYLGLNRCGVADLSPLGGLPSLVSLYLDDNGITDLSPLGGIPSLEQLSLHDNDITDLAPLSGLTNLKSLWLSGNNSIESLEPLAGLAQLTGLSLPGVLQDRPKEFFAPVEHVFRVEFY